MKTARASCLAAILGAAAPCLFAQVLIDPVVVELGPKQRSAALTLTLSPKATRPLVLQSDVMLWRQTLRGETQLQPSSDLIVVPPIVELKPGESQLVRVALRGGRAGDAEQAYRLLIEDAGTGTQDAGTGISFRMRYDLPVMVGAAAPPRQALQWSTCDNTEPATLCVRLANDGNRRVTLKQMALAGDGWKVEVEHPGTVLARSAREWRLPRPAGKSGPLMAVAAQTTRSESVGAPLPTP